MSRRSRKVVKRRKKKVVRRKPKKSSKRTATPECARLAETAGSDSVRREPLGESVPEDAGRTGEHTVADRPVQPGRPVAERVEGPSNDLAPGAQQSSAAETKGRGSQTEAANAQGNPVTANETDGSQTSVEADDPRTEMLERCVIRLPAVHKVELQHLNAFVHVSWHTVLYRVEIESWKRVSELQDLLTESNGFPPAAEQRLVDNTGRTLMPDQTIGEYLFLDTGGDEPLLCSRRARRAPDAVQGIEDRFLAESIKLTQSDYDVPELTPPTYKGEDIPLQDMGTIPEEESAVGSSAATLACGLCQLPMASQEAGVQHLQQVHSENITLAVTLERSALAKHAFYERHKETPRQDAKLSQHCFQCGLCSYRHLFNEGLNFGSPDACRWVRHINHEHQRQLAQAVTEAVFQRPLQKAAMLLGTIQPTATQPTGTRQDAEGSTLNASLCCSLYDPSVFRLIFDFL